MTKPERNVLTKTVTHPQVVTIAVFMLGGADKFVDTEDVAVKAAELAPGRFSWRKYPEQINLELVRVYLSDAKKAGHGAYLDGSGRRGWTLTAAGLQFARIILPKLGKGDLARDPKDAQGGSVSQVRRDRERKRIERTEAWARWVASDKSAILSTHAKEVFRIDSYVTGDLISVKIERMRKLFVDDSELERFLQFMAEKILNAE